MGMMRTPLLPVIGKTSDEREQEFESELESIANNCVLILRRFDRRNRDIAALNQMVSVWVVAVDVFEDRGLERAEELKDTFFQDLNEVCPATQG